MSDPKQTRPAPGGGQTGRTPEGGDGAGNRGADSGTAERALCGMNGDADPSGTSVNVGHGDSRDERGGGR
jgi:hypothetical protein